MLISLLAANPLTDSAWAIALILALLGLQQLINGLYAGLTTPVAANLAIADLNTNARPAPTIKKMGGNIVSLKIVDYQLGADSISANLRSGERLLLRQASGSGKSQLLAAVFGVLPSTEGSIFINGSDISDAAISWSSRIAYLPQAPYFFNMTLRENFALLPANDNIDISSLLTELGLGSWLSGLPQGLDTMVDNQSVNLSGGQLRRLALARVFYQDADLVLLDEPFEALDQANISLVQTAIANYCADKILVIASHTCD